MGQFCRTNLESDKMEAMRQILSNFPQGYVAGLVLNGTFITIAYFLIWKRFGQRLSNWRIQFTQRADATQIKAELKNGVLVLAVGALFSSLVIYLITQGYTKIYTDFSQHSPFVAIGGFFLIWLIDDAWFYWCHRLMHHPSVYRYVHAVHHQSVDVTPYSSMSFHVLEAATLTLWILPVSFVLPIYAPFLGVMQLIGLFNNVKSHLGYELYPASISRSWLRFLVPSTHHNMHHTHFNGNYGLHFRFWDKVCGTEFSNYEVVFEQIQTRKKEGVKAESELVYAGVPPEREVNKEFVMAPDWSKQFPGGVVATEAIVHFSGENRVSVLANETVLDALIRADISVPYSCRSGICGTCKCRLRSGQVTMINPQALTDQQISDGYVLLCQSVPITEKIEVEF